VLGVLGGVLFQLIDGGTTYHRAIAYGLWAAAALLLIAMPIAGSKRLYKHTSWSLPESWAFVGAAIVLTVLGAVIDTALS
jgi:hypothetical protein